jgi:hypothetical protein
MSVAFFRRNTSPIVTITCDGATANNHQGYLRTHSASHHLMIISRLDAFSHNQPHRHHHVTLGPVP